MQKDDPSGYINKDTLSGYLIDARFTMMEDMPSRGYSRLVKAMRHGRWYMLKGLIAELRFDQAYIVMLHKEFETAVRLQHQNIVTVIDFENVPEIGPCIVMEWVDGENLDQWLPGKTKKQKRQVLDQILTAMEYIHSRQVVHRDLKPSNIMVTRNGANVKIIDFGLGDSDSDTRFKQPAGTLGYTSPEQTARCESDQRNDIYSLGCVIEDMQLGWKASRVARRCKESIEKRYSDVSKVRKALNRNYLKIGLLWLLFVAALTVVAVEVFSPEPLVLDYVQSHPEALYEDQGNKIYRAYPDTMEFIAWPDMEGVVEVSMGYAPPNKTLIIPEAIIFDGDTLTVEGISYKAFNDACFSYVYMPPTMRYIRDYAFWKSGIREVDIPDGVKYVARASFAMCRHLKKITFGTGITDIGRDVFNGSNLIEEIWIKATTPPLLDPMSAYEYGATLYVPRGCADLYREAPNWGNFSNIVEVDY